MVRSRSFDELAEEALTAPFEGWSWEWLEGRRRTTDTATPDLGGWLGELIPSARSMLDVGTGGGEFLSSLAPLPPVAVATEAYPPNVTLAATRLRELGAAVVHVASDVHTSLPPHPEHPSRGVPFADASFDLVMARSTAFCPSEVFRILRPGGRLVAAGGLTTPGTSFTLHEHLQAPGPDWGSWDVLATVEDAGFVIEAWQTSRHTNLYLDIGAVIYVLKNVPWAVPGFSFDAYRDRLISLHDRIEREGAIETWGTGFFLRASRP